MLQICQQRNRRNTSNGSILYWENTTFRANIRPHTAPHFKALQQKATPTNINSSRNSRPSFLIDDVRFWMLFSNMEHAPFTTPHTWHNRVWNNALKMKIRCQPKLCYSVAFKKLFDFKPYDPRPALPHLRKAVPTRKRRQRGQA